VETTVGRHQGERQRLLNVVRLKLGIVPEEVVPVRI
jgi:hypothetical protein